MPTISESICPPFIFTTAVESVTDTDASDSNKVSVIFSVPLFMNAVVKFFHVPCSIFRVWSFPIVIPSSPLPSTVHSPPSTVNDVVLVIGPIESGLYDEPLSGISSATLSSPVNVYVLTASLNPYSFLADITRLSILSLENTKYPFKYLTKYVPVTPAPRTAVRVPVPPMVVTSSNPSLTRVLTYLLSVSVVTITSSINIFAVPN